ncbi:asparagine-linked glycosylation protein [Coelomomyces lativittatus]|nr:asparagine-linked glycosylation protein [Coelomomyces lativittatus]
MSFVSTDMLDMVSNRTSQFNNRPKIANSILLSKLKLWYYRIFAFLYGFSGRRSHLVFANSTWTARHLQSLFRMPIHIVYPPCDTSTLSSFSLSNRLPYIVSIAQFRPEKRHRLQVLAFQQCCAQLPKSTQLILMGGCRGQEDETRVEHLRDFIHSLDLDERIKLVLNASYHEIQKYLQQASIGLHTMKEEHFGIGIVEYMAAGLIPLAHRSGGPQTDIVVPYDNQPTGFLADTIEDYAESMLHIFSLNSEEQMKLRENARASVHRFSEKKFDEAWMKHWQQVIPSKLLNLGI